MKKKLELSLFDFIVLFFLILCIAILALFIYKDKKGEKRLFITTPKEKYYYFLDKDKLINVNGEIGITSIEIKNGKFRFVDSICNGKDCVHIGWVGIAGFPVICLPNKVSAYIVTDKKENQFDGITQ